MRRLLLLSIIAPAWTWAQPSYELVDLSQRYGTSFSAVSIGDDGIILGTKSGMACIADRGRLQFFPRFEGRNWYAVSRSKGGHVLGYDEGYYRAILYQGGHIADIGVNGAYNSQSVHDVNVHGEIVGKVPILNPFVWQKGVLKLLPTPGYAIPRSISDSGLIVGVIVSTGKAALWADGDFRDINPRWAISSDANAINTRGEIAGSARRLGAPTEGPTLWRDGIAIQLSPAEIGSAWDLNDSCQVVGQSGLLGNGYRAFLWDNGSITRLDNLISNRHRFLYIGNAYSINNSGQILARAHTLNGDYYVLLNPIVGDEISH